MLISLVPVLMAIVVGLLLVTSWLDERARRFDRAYIRQRVEEETAKQRAARIAGDRQD